MSTGSMINTCEERSVAQLFDFFNLFVFQRFQKCVKVAYSVDHEHFITTSVLFMSYVNSNE